MIMNTLMIIIPFFHSCQAWSRTLINVDCFSDTNADKNLCRNHQKDKLKKKEFCSNETVKWKVFGLKAFSQIVHVILSKHY